MTSFLPTLNGHPDQLRRLADSLMGGASRLSAINTVLLGLRAGARWDSDSGRLFEAAVQAPPPVIAAVIERYAGAAQAVRSLAEALEEAQHDVTASIASNTEAQRRHDILMVQRGRAIDPLEQHQLVRAIAAEVAVMEAAQRRHLSAIHRHMEADRRCARQLRALAKDAVDDPTGYTWMVNSGNVAKPVALMGGMLPGQAKLVGVAGIAAGAVSQVGLLLFYDEGSWKQIGVNVLSSAITVVGSVMVAGAGVGGRAVIEGGKRVFTKTANPSTGFRLGAGARQTYDDWILATRQKLGLKVPATMPRVPPRPRMPNPSKMGKVGNFARQKADDAFINSWELAMANGKGAQAMFVAGITTQKGPAVVKQINTVHDRLTAPPEKKAEEKRATPTYP